MNWTEDELKLALALYCQLPFGKMHSRNKDIISLATKIGRTPSAVAMKLVNFASLDPEIVNSGRVGLGNASAMDRLVWDKFQNNWDAEISKAADVLLLRQLNMSILCGISNLWMTEVTADMLRPFDESPHK
jgi:hypothetical protein